MDHGWFICSPHFLGHFQVSPCLLPHLFWHSGQSDFFFKQSDHTPDLLKTFWRTPYHFLKRFYLLIHQRHTERGRDTDRGRGRLPARSLTWDWILGPGSRPEPKADAQWLSHSGIPGGPHLIRVKPKGLAVTLAWPSPTTVYLLRA